jgi:hypothetical protein
VSGAIPWVWRRGQKKKNAVPKAINITLKWSLGFLATLGMSMGKVCSTGNIALSFGALTRLFKIKCNFHSDKNARQILIKNVLTNQVIVKLPLKLFSGRLIFTQNAPGVKSSEIFHYS